MHYFYIRVNAIEVQVDKHVLKIQGNMATRNIT